MSRHPDEDQYLAAVGELIRAYRNQAELTQDEIAGVAGVGRASIANMEAGRQNIDVFALVRIADACGVAVTNLLPGTGLAPSVPLARATVAQRRAGRAAMAWAEATADFQEALDELKAARRGDDGGERHD